MSGFFALENGLTITLDVEKIQTDTELSVSQIQEKFIGNTTLKAGALSTG